MTINKFQGRTEEEAIEKAKQDVADLSEKAIAQMETLVVKNEFLTELLRYLISREK